MSVEKCAMHTGGSPGDVSLKAVFEGELGDKV